jgi:hypothetical protein
MTELFDAEVSVRTGTGGAVTAVRLDGRWEEIDRVAARWRVETDWWRTPVRRDYWRCLLHGGDCVEICRDHSSDRWTLVRRYD